MSKHDEFGIKNEELCIKNEELCTQNDEFCSMAADGSAVPMGLVSNEWGGRGIQPLMASFDVSNSQTATPPRARSTAQTVTSAPVEPPGC